MTYILHAFIYIIFLNQDSSPAPSWGSPAQGLAWGSPLINTGVNTPKADSLNPQLNTPSLPRHSSPSFHMRSGNGHSANNRPHSNNSPGVRKQFSTPPNFSPRPLFQSSPAHMMPRDNTPRHRFPHQNNRNSFCRGMPSHGGGGSPYSHQKPQFSQRVS